MIKWPAIIKYLGDHELLFLTDEVELRLNPDFQAQRFDFGDQLIDSNGATYELVDVNEIDLLRSSGMLDLGKLTELVRCHASEIGSCCVSKLMFSSIEAAIASVEYLQSE